jgi:hypothetical protein
MKQALDLFCCAGGATAGYQRAGFTVTGVDKIKYPEYCGDNFIEMDVIEFLRGWDRAVQPFAFIHASPPCQADHALNSGTQAGKANAHTSLTAATRAALQRYAPDVPWVIEQPVGGSKEIRKDLKLHGDMFGLDVKRARWFEFGNIEPPVQPAQAPSRGRTRGWRHGEYFDGPYLAVYGKGGGKATVAEAQTAMGMPWVADWAALTEAIPPVYAEYIGRHVFGVLDSCRPEA